MRSPRSRRSNPRASSRRYFSTNSINSVSRYKDMVRIHTQDASRNRWSKSLPQNYYNGTPSRLHRTTFFLLVFLTRIMTGLVTYIGELDIIHVDLVLVAIPITNSLGEACFGNDTKSPSTDCPLGIRNICQALEKWTIGICLQGRIALKNWSHLWYQKGQSHHKNIDLHDFVGFFGWGCLTQMSWGCWYMMKAVSYHKFHMPRWLNSKMLVSVAWPLHVVLQDISAAEVESPGLL